MAANGLVMSMPVCHHFVSLLQFQMNHLQRPASPAPERDGPPPGVPELGVALGVETVSCPAPLDGGASSLGVGLVGPGGAVIEDDPEGEHKERDEEQHLPSPSSRIRGQSRSKPSGSGAIISDPADAPR